MLRCIVPLAIFFCCLSVLAVGFMFVLGHNHTACIGENVGCLSIVLRSHDIPVSARSLIRSSHKFSKRTSWWNALLSKCQISNESLKIFLGRNETWKEGTQKDSRKQVIFQKNLSWSTCTTTTGSRIWSIFTGHLLFLSCSHMSVWLTCCALTHSNLMSWWMPSWKLVLG